MATKPLPDALPLSPDTNASTTMITTSPTDPSSPYPSKPPAALTIILSTACGIVATCILLTIVFLLLRHRSSKQAFRQGQQQQQHTLRASYASNTEPNFKSHADMPVDAGSASTSAPDADPEDRGVAMYLPVLLHGSSQHSLAYPKAAHLGSESSRTDAGTTMIPLSTHIV